MRLLNIQRRRRPKIAAAAGIVAIAAAAGLSACGSPNAVTQPSATSAPPEFHQVSQASGSPITVWVDSTRLPGVQAYQKSHPNVKMNIVTYSGDANGSNYLQTKIELYDRAGSGWPDVVFSEEYNDAAWSTAQGTDWVAPLNKGVVPQATLDGFAPNALAPCTVDGNVYCLRNDIGQNVLWYNAKLMKQFGYQVPTTWEQYQALGAQVAKQHPGYITGSVGDPWTPEVYFWASQCPANTISGNSVAISTGNANCTKMAALLDAGVKNGSLTKQSAFATSFVKQYAAKTLMLIGPSWYGQYVFNAALKVPAGQVAAGAPLTWSGQSAPSTGDVGGGIWMVSKYSRNLAAAGALAQYMATSNDYQLTAPTYPAYKPAATAWLAAQAKQHYFASDVSAVFEQAANEIWGGWGTGRFSQENIWAASMTPPINGGKTISSLLPAWQTAIENQARSFGYTVGG
ncbi:MAG TPA: ABC transporter substrate-binding protein [Trebonia sp.]|jgi:multiple sugar transport system substrate-binding protein|nr:ABC transporter substrate-binding protein [Trebonia sp.]